METLSVRMVKPSRSNFDCNRSKIKLNFSIEFREFEVFRVDQDIEDFRISKSKFEIFEKLLLLISSC